jgi:hypothetical protein
MTSSVWSLGGHRFLIWIHACQCFVVSDRCQWLNTPVRILVATEHAPICSEPNNPITVRSDEIRLYAVSSFILTIT